MYLRDGKPMQYPQEGAAFFEPIRFGTGQFLADEPDMPAAAPPAGAPSMAPSAAAAVADCIECKERAKLAVWAFTFGAVGGYFLLGKRRKR